MYFYSLVKHHCIFLYKLVKTRAQCSSAVVTTAVPEKEPLHARLGVYTEQWRGRAQNRQGRLWGTSLCQEGRGEDGGKGRLFPGRRAARRQQEMGSHMAEAEMKRCEPGGRRVLEHRAVKDRVWLVKTEQNTLASVSAAPTAVLPALTSFYHSLPKAMQPWGCRGEWRERQGHRGCSPLNGAPWKTLGPATWREENSTLKPPDLPFFSFAHLNAF